MLVRKSATGLFRAGVPSWAGGGLKTWRPPTAEVTVVMAVAGKAIKANQATSPVSAVIRNLAPHESPLSHVISSLENWGSARRARLGTAVGGIRTVGAWAIAALLRGSMTVESADRSVCDTSGIVRIGGIWTVGSLSVNFLTDL